MKNVSQTSDEAAGSKLSGALRWVLSYAFFLALFALLISLAGYGLASLSDTNRAQPQSAGDAKEPASQPGEAPSGVAGHAAPNSSGQK
jgi:hypothetical protein